MNYVYLLRCADGTLYCGWTTDLAARIRAHNSGKGAKYTRSRLPAELVYYETYEDRHEALSREWHIKRLSREEKLALIRDGTKETERSAEGRPAEDQSTARLASPSTKKIGGERTMIQNETMRSILARRSYKVFDSRPIEDEVLETIVTAGLYAPTGMNRQPWHITVLQSKQALEKFGAARRALPLPPGIPAHIAANMGDPMRNAPVMILVSAKEGGTSFEDSCLAMENMFIAAASLGVMSGWDHATVKDLFRYNPELKAELIPEGYELYAAAFFGYPGPSVKDRGERKGAVEFK